VIPVTEARAPLAGARYHHLKPDRRAQMRRVTRGPVIALALAAIALGGCDEHPHAVYPDYRAPDLRPHDATPPPTCPSTPCVTGEPCVQTLAGSGVRGYADGAAATARFDRPWSVAVDAQGAVYVGDRPNMRIRVIRAGVVSTFAGSQAGYLDGPADQARFGGIQGIAVDPAGTTVYVADREARKIRAISSGVVTTMTIANTQQTFDPIDVAVGSDGLYLIDFGNINCFTCAARWPPYVGRVAAGQLSIVPESYVLDPATANLKAVHFLAQPETVTVGPDGAIYHPTDKGIRVLRGGTAREIAIDPYTEVADLAVDAQSRVYGVTPLHHRVGYLDSNDKLISIPPIPAKPEAAINDIGCADGPASVARFSTPQGIAVDAAGKRIYVADLGNNRIRVVELRYGE
jgi:DNA-binding beta-propeller fold protein YncE